MIGKESRSKFTV